MASILLLGATGMTGSHILSTLRSLPSNTISRIDILTRRSTPATTPSPDDPTTNDRPPALNPFISPDTATWAGHINSLSTIPSIFISSLATTRAAAGGFANQYILEHDLNIELARTARERGTKVYVLISYSGANKDSMVPYSRMKGEIEEGIKAMEFEHTIIVRPGLISGTREESRPAEAVVRKMAWGMGAVSGGLLKDFWAQDADVIARAAVNAGLKASRGELKEKVTVLGGGDIIRLGKKDWNQVQTKS